MSVARYQGEMKSEKGINLLIPEIPIDWNFVPIKHVMKLQRDLVGKRSKEFTLLSLTKRGVIIRDLSNNFGKFPASFETYQVINPNELVFCLFDIDETPRTVGLSAHKGMLTGAYNVYSVQGANPSFLYWFFLYIDNRKGLRPFYTGLRKVVRSETFGSIKIPLPPLPTQQLIATYLDRKTQAIDALITAREEQIARLQEKRASLIHRAVTKGITEGVEMKDSGIEWIGEIPKHWELWKIAHAFRTIGSGGTPKSDKLDYYEGDVPWVTTSELRESLIIDTQKKLTQKALQEVSSLTIFKPGTLLIAMYGATIGRLGILDIEACTNQACCALSDSDEILIDYMYFWFQAMRDSIIQLASGGGQPNISQEKIKQLRVGCPSIKEQQRIVDYINQKTTQIDTLITTVQQTITTLKEYRQSLITEAVTGKLDPQAMQAYLEPRNTRKDTKGVDL